MDLTTKHIWQLELADYFVKQHQYLLMKVDKETSLWLVNPSNQTYPWIVLLLDEYSKGNELSEQLNFIQNLVSEQFHIQGNRLELYVGEIGQGMDFPGGHREGLMLGQPMSESLQRMFPDLGKVLQPVNEGDEERRLKQVRDRIKTDSQNLQTANQNPLVQKIKNSPNKMNRITPWVTYIVLAICVSVFVFGKILGMMFPDNSSVDIAIMIGGYYKAFIMGLKEYWRLLTSAFVHTDTMHFITNMISLFYLGRFCESAFGHKKMALIILLSAIMGNLFVFVGQGNSVVIGLSGGLYGLMASILVFYMSTALWKVPVIRNQFLMLMGVNLMMNFLPGVSYLAHAGGFVMGLALAFLFIPSKKWEPYRKHILIALGFLLGVIIYVMLNAKLDTIYVATDKAVSNLAYEIGLKNYANHIITKMLEYYRSVGL